ncbi:MAG TPA: hypothetical protein IAC44_07215 [Candidatus Merdimorpha stercoravium]|uniref:Uncharacterized protein n=1 Tax=Candidatus Merdimorpha stercoravium TaxID=2840863 RepID=A0A9D1HB60_9FLAO|nr:hypothetical protein [Candidatus Merdimorpha stercoravium]
MKHFRCFLLLALFLGALGAQAQQEEPDYVRVRVETHSGGWRGDIGEFGVFYGYQPMFKDREGYYHCQKNRVYNVRPLRRTKATRSGYYRVDCSARFFRPTPRHDFQAGATENDLSFPIEFRAFDVQENRPVEIKISFFFD